MQTAPGESARKVAAVLAAAGTVRLPARDVPLDGSALRDVLVSLPTVR